MKKKITIISIVTIVILTTFLVTTLFITRYESNEDMGKLISQDIAHLSAIFEKINNTAKIVGFDYQKNPINFLNIKKDGFVGSEVGPMNLAYPDKWDGPYVQDHPSMQGKEYQIVHTYAGYFITPGDGVRLPNGKIVGTDILLDENADISAMMQDESQLMFEGAALAIPLFQHTQPYVQHGLTPVQEDMADEMV